MEKAYIPTRTIMKYLKSTKAQQKLHLNKVIVVSPSFRGYFDIAFNNSSSPLCLLSMGVDELSLSPFINSPYLPQGHCVHQYYHKVVLLPFKLHMYAYQKTHVDWAVLAMSLQSVVHGQGRVNLPRFAVPLLAFGQIKFHQEHALMYLNPSLSEPFPNSCVSIFRPATRCRERCSQTTRCQTRSSSSIHILMVASSIKPPR